MISGLRRYESAMKLNWTAIDAIVFENMDEQSRILVMIAENAQRQDLKDFDLVSSLVHYLAISTDKTDDEVVAFLFKLRNHDSGNIKSLSFEEKKLKKTMENCLLKTDKYSLTHVINKLKVLTFNPAIIKAMKEHKLLYTYAVQLNKIKDEGKMNDLLTRFVSKQISKDELLKEIRKILGDNKPVIPFGDTFKKLKEYNNFPDEKKQLISAKVKELDS